MTRVLVLLLFVGVLGTALFVSAGRLDLPFFWAYLGVLLTAGLAATPCIDRDLVKERLRPGQGGVDRHLRVWVMPFFLGNLVIAGLDVGRFHWSDTVPLELQIAGLAGMVPAYALSCWAISVNRFFSPVVRIQTERGHHLVTDGPYRWVRHPGYSATLWIFPCAGLALGSWWSLVPLAGAMVLIVRRILIEDVYLMQNLAGYVGYAERVRYRVLPHVW